LISVKSIKSEIDNESIKHLQVYIDIVK
jgi:hypothetical protein